MRRALLSLSVLVSLSACGGALPAPEKKPAPGGAPTASAAPPPAPRGPSVRFVVVHPGLVEPHLKVDAEKAKAWGKDPANAALIQPGFRHVLIKTSGDAKADDAAKKKIDALLARLKKGEKMEKLAKEASEDPGSKDNGGQYPGFVVAQFVPEVREAFEALKPGTFAEKPVKSQFGWHLVAKDAVDDQSVAQSYRLWLAGTTMKNVAEQLQGLLKHVPSGQTAQGVATKAFADAVGVQPAAFASEPPEVVRFAAATPDAELQPECQQIRTGAKEGKLLAQGDVVVAAAMTEDPSDVTETVGGMCMVEKEEQAQRSPPPDPSGWVAAAPPKPRTFELYREDETDVVAAIPKGGTPKGAELKLEAAPSGARKKEMRGLMLFPRTGKEAEADVLARAREGIAAVKHPKGSFFVLEATENDDGAMDGYRSFLVKEPAILDDRDVASAKAEDSPAGPIVSVELSPAGAKRLEEATAAGLHRRMVVMIDGLVTSAPVVMAPLKTGRIAISPTGETEAARKANAAKLAKALGAKK